MTAHLFETTSADPSTQEKLDVLIRRTYVVRFALTNAGMKFDEPYPENLDAGPGYPEGLDEVSLLLSFYSQARARADNPEMTWPEIPSQGLNHTMYGAQKVARYVRGVGLQPLSTLHSLEMALEDYNTIQTSQEMADGDDKSLPSRIEDYPGKVADKQIILPQCQRVAAIDAASLLVPLIGGQYYRFDFNQRSRDEILGKKKHS